MAILSGVGSITPFQSIFSKADFFIFRGIDGLHSSRKVEVMRQIK